MDEARHIEDRREALAERDDMGAWVAKSLLMNPQTQSVSTEDRQFMLVPDSATIQSLEGYELAPHIKRAQVALITRESFCAYVNAHAGPTTVLFADFTREKSTIGCVFDYHGTGKDDAMWGAHTAALTLRLSDDWKTWTSMDDRPFAQLGFAEFIEDNLHAFVKPKAAEMLEIVRDFKAARKATFGSSVNATNGDLVFQYEQATTTEKTKRGSLEVPEEIELRLPVFDGEQPVSVKALFRYTISPEGQLSMRYKLRQKVRVKVQEADSVLFEIKELIKQPVFDGSVTGMMSPAE